MSDLGDVQIPEFREICTPRLRLRTVQLSDATDMLPILSRQDVMQWTSRGVISTVEEAKRWIQDKALGKDVYNFIIESRECPHAGIMGTFHLPSIGYLIHPSQAGRGYATEALQALIPVLFDVVPLAEDGGWNYLEALTDLENGASRRVLEKCGFTLCEIRYQDFCNPITGVRDTCFYRLARPGFTLTQLGLLPSKDDDEESKIVPPIE